MQQYLYSFILFFSVIVPFIFSFHKRLQFHLHFKSFFLGLIGMLLIFIPWDIWFTSLGIWGFNPKYLTGLYFFNLPIEECLFFICIPFCCIFTYHVVWTLSKNKSIKPMKRACWIISFALLLAGVLLNDLMYTAYTFIGLSIAMLIAPYYVNMKVFFKTYLILLFPFLVVNGLLTGSFIEDQIVWYDGNNNISLRILTIPVEDFFYSFFMLLFVMIGYQRSIDLKVNI